MVYTLLARYDAGRTAIEAEQALKLSWELERIQPAWLVLALATAAWMSITPSLATAKAKAQRRGSEMATCDIHIAAGGSALAEAVAQAPGGARLCLEPGEHLGGFSLTRSITLVGVQGTDKTILKASGPTPVLRVDDDGLAIRIEGLTLQGGEADAGGGLRISGRGKVQVADCRFAANRAGMIGGGGVYASQGLLSIERSAFDANQGRQGGALFLDGVVHAELTRCSFEGNRADAGGAVRIAEAAKATFKASTFKDNHAGSEANTLAVSGTRSRIPSVTLDHCSVHDGSVVNGPEIPGDIRLKTSQVPASWRGVNISR